MKNCIVVCLLVLASVAAFGATTCEHNPLVQNGFSTSGNTEIIAAPSGRSIRVCAFAVNTAVASATTVKLTYGTGTNCGTGTTDASIAVPMVATATNAPVGMVINPGENSATTIPVGNALCLNLSAANAVNFQVWYAIL